VVDFWLALTLAIITLGRLIRRAWTHYRWDSRPRRRAHNGLPAQPLTRRLAPTGDGLYSRIAVYPIPVPFMDQRELGKAA
jgi:hypothetical protein